MIVITGATGNTGSVAAHTLLDQGESVRVFGRSAERMQPFADRGADVVVGDIARAEDLREAFDGAESDYAMVPPPYGEEDPLGFYHSVALAFQKALQDSSLTHVVFLSSIGADLPEGLGPVSGLHMVEQHLNELDATHVLFLRAGYFMENMMGSLHSVAQENVVAYPLPGDVPVQMVATRDIGGYVAERLKQRDFEGKSFAELQGQRDLTMEEATEILGRTIGNEGVQYHHAPDERAREAMRGWGMSERAIDGMLEMNRGMAEGRMRPLTPRDDRNNTPTSFEWFAENMYRPAFDHVTKQG